jgi:hypothetical protein
VQEIKIAISADGTGAIKEIDEIVAALREVSDAGK